MKRRKGFTLIELSIVIMMLSTIFIMLFLVFYTSHEISRKNSSKKGANRRDILYAIENIRSSITRTYYIDNQRRVLFVGKADRLVFSSSNPNAEEEDSASVREVSFYLRKMEDSKMEDMNYLIRREDEMVDSFPTQGGVEHIFLENVKSFQLKYSERGDKWVDEWNSRTSKKIPRLVRIEIVSLVGNSFLKYESLAHPAILFK
ncbi:type II secretion system protein GspJ [Leptospira idonii]|uniref:Type II secretion system protein J n=1 Tax=Leptospira idonii TaxID=1193500 RepID=A0A4V3JXS5_9LEPT|nr:type II secretion system protein GspJ [Leptospira idonii]TGN18546.1 prepilin-type N-terminal cleavage/methylation domain-containing protein [Leptospira idonii]